jgi:hypothetical protein
MKNFEEPSYGWPAYSDFIITLLTGLVSLGFNVISNKFTWKFFYDNCRERKNDELRQAKATKAASCFYKSMYFMGASIWGYCVLKDEKYLPSSLLGHGDLSRLTEDYPKPNWPEGFKLYYLGTMGFHVH